MLPNFPSASFSHLLPSAQFLLRCPDPFPGTKCPATSMMWLNASRAISRLTRLKLLKAAERELRFENSLQAESGFLTRYLRLYNYSVISPPGKAYIVLEKVKDDYTMKVKIKARTAAIDISKEATLTLTPQGQESEEEESKLLPDVTEFSISLKRQNQEKEVHFSCSTKQSTLLIHQIAIGSNLESSQSTAYQGPYFQLLSKVRPTQPLQTQWAGVLRWLGVDGDLAKAVESFSLMKETEEYGRWLRSVRDFAAKE